MAPPSQSLIKKDVFILDVHCVVFPQVRMTVPVPYNAFEQLCAHCDIHDHSMVGILAVKRRDPRGNEMYEIGTYSRLLSHQKNPASSRKTSAPQDHSPSVSLGVEGRHRFRLIEWTNKAKKLATIELIPEPQPADSVKIKALCASVQDYLLQILESQSHDKLLASILQQGGLQRGLANGRWSNNPGALADLIGITAGQLSLHERQNILETIDVEQRLELTRALLERIHEANRLSRELQQKLNQRSEDDLKEQILRRQLAEVQRELRKLKSPGAAEDNVEEEDDELLALQAKLDKASLSEQARKIAKHEMKRMHTIQPHHPEYNVCRTYLETLASLPWKVSSQDTADLALARKILDEDHFGLESVKKRILEFLAVRLLRQDMKGPILCLHGPPGVGKTSLGRSVARALGRKFHRLALGGVRDEAEIRGHRRTYIGSMPGVFIQCLQQVGVNNPLVLLDEIDKLSHNSMFNPQGAMLEILDSEQNHTFCDHYLGVPFDLSNIFFLATCNEYETIDRPLLDRMEVIEIAGYTLQEKKFIALNHLVPKQRSMHALNGVDGKPDLIEFDADAMEHLISRWTHESGVRGLERRIAEICRWAAQQLVATSASQRATSHDLAVEKMSTPEEKRNTPATGTAQPADASPTSRKPMRILSDMAPIRVTRAMLPAICGIEISDHSVAERLTVGVSMGLAVTSVGGELLFIETCYVPGNRNEGPLIVTGQLGPVMKESVWAALSLLKSRKLELKYDIHVHFPAGAVPKDGPSAGVATTLALLSLILNEPLRSDTACTGEITLRGNVLPVGGVKEKVIAAHRAGVKYVLLPEQNRRHVQMDLPANLLTDVTIVYLKNIDDATKHFFGSSLSLEGLRIAAFRRDSGSLSVTVPSGHVESRDHHTAHARRARTGRKTLKNSPRVENMGLLDEVWMFDQELFPFHARL